MNKLMENWKTHCALHNENAYGPFDSFREGHSMRDAEIKQLTAERDTYKQALADLGVTPEEAKVGVARSQAIHEERDNLRAVIYEAKIALQMAISHLYPAYKQREVISLIDEALRETK